MSYIKFAALGDSTRLQIFERLQAGPRSVATLAQDLPVSRPAVSQHLKILKDAGLVRDTAEGTRRIYSIDQGGLAAAHAYLDRFCREAQDAFRAEVARQLEERKHS